MRFAIFAVVNQRASTMRATSIFFVFLSISAPAPAYAFECIVDGPRYELRSDVVNWSMKIGSGQSCIRGLRLGDVIVEKLELVSSPRTGQVTIHGPGFAYSAKSKYEGEDDFAIALSGKIGKSTGNSTIRITVSVEKPDIGDTAQSYSREPIAAPKPLITSRVDGPTRTKEFHWSPGIGDPTFAGWFTVLLYLVAAMSASTTAKDAGFPERKLWRVISIGFIGLGINKQLDLQTAFTELGRVVASTQGWYEQRRIVQFWFIVAVAAICLLMALVLLVLARRAPKPTRLAVVGVVIVLGFVTIRAASFHHFDQFIGSRVLGLKWNWVLEMGGISIVLIASEWRRRVVPRAATGETRA